MYIIFLCFQAFLATKNCVYKKWLLHHDHKFIVLCLFYFVCTIVMFKEFLGFLSQYNIVGIAIWLLIATKVGELVKWMIENLITPMILNPILTRLKVKKMEDLSFKGILYGKVISTLIDFLITAFLVFLVVKYAHITLAVK